MANAEKRRSAIGDRMHHEVMMQLPVAQVLQVGTGGILAGPEQISFWRDAIQTADSDRPTTVVIDLSLAVFLPQSVENFVFPIARKVASGYYGPSRLVVATPDRSLRNVLAALSAHLGVAMYVCDSPSSLADAQPVGVTPTEQQSLDLLRASGGGVSASDLADEAGLELSAASNRLVNLERRGLVFRIKRGGREGDLFADPRLAPLPAWYGDQGNAAES